MKRSLLILSLCLFANSASAAMSIPWKKIAKALDLNQDQIAQMVEIRKSSKEDRQALREEVSKAKKTYRRFLRKNKPEQEIRGAFEALHDAVGRLSKARFDVLMDIRGVLDEDQNHKFSKFMRYIKKKKRCPKDAEKVSGQL